MFWGEIKSVHALLSVLILPVGGSAVSCRHFHESAYFSGAS
jgi:hypothetical protein